MNVNDFMPENIDLRAMRVQEAFGDAASAYYKKFEEVTEQMAPDFFDNMKFEWFDVPSERLGGQTPKDYIAENFGEEPDFEACLELIKPFFYDETNDVPGEIRAMVLVHREKLLSWAKDFLDVFTEPTGEYSYTIAIGTFYTLMGEIFDEKIVDKTIELFYALDYEKYEYCLESMCTYLCSFKEGVDKIVATLSGTEAFTEREFTLLSFLSSCEFHSDDVYRTIRTCCKRAGSDFLPAVYYCFADYGEGRAVSYLRTTAKKFRDLWLSGVDAEENKEIYFSIISVIEQLGGNTEDFED